jgi:hypothetical protein
VQPLNRRACILGLVSLPAAAAVLEVAGPAHADETAAAPAATPPAAPKWKLFIERDFLLRYPPNDFTVIEDFSGAAPGNVITIFVAQSDSSPQKPHIFPSS